MGLQPFLGATLCQGATNAGFKQSRTSRQATVTVGHSGTMRDSEGLDTPRSPSPRRTRKLEPCLPPPKVHIPGGWERRYTEHGTGFFVHVASGKKQWHPPVSTATGAQNASWVEDKAGSERGRSHEGASEAAAIQRALSAPQSTTAAATAANQELRNAPPLHDSFDFTRVVIINPTKLQAAMEEWKRQSAHISSHCNTTLTVSFVSGISTAMELHGRVRAMGVSIVENAFAGVAQPKPRPPFADPTGDTHQPGLAITWQSAPAIVSTALQVWKSKGWVIVRASRGAITPRIKVLLSFFGSIAEVVGNAPSAIKPKAGAAATNDALSWDVEALLNPPEAS